MSNIFYMVFLGPHAGGGQAPNRFADLCLSWQI
jgi:hypothetical protein